MNEDNFNRVCKAETFLRATEKPLNFGLSPNDLATIRACHETRKKAVTEKVVGMSCDKTNPHFVYRAGESFFDKLIAGVQVVCGESSFIDPEATRTMAVARCSPA